MSVEQATSVSGGVFAFKGKSKHLNEDDYLTDLKDKGKKNRAQVYHEIWEDLHTNIEILRTDMNCQIFDDLLKFVSGCHEKRVLQHLSDFENGNPILGEIPTALLVTGVNTPDHDIMFANLAGMLRSKMSPLVARVVSHDSHRINTLLSDIVAQLMNITPTAEDKDDWALEGNSGIESQSAEKLAENPLASPFKLKGGLKRRRALNLTSLVKWYKKTFGKRSKFPFCSPNKKTKYEQGSAEGYEVNGKENLQQPLVIIVFEDVENVTASVFQDFISLCHSYLPHLPIVLILGIATAVTAIHQVLPAGITSLLSMEKFQAPPASQYLTKLMDQIIMTPNVGFKLGPRVFHFLYDTFFYQDFSILNLTRGIQHCLNMHTLTQPLSLLCSAPKDMDLVEHRLTSGQIESLRKAPDFIRYTECFPEEMKQKLMTDNAATKKQLLASIEELHRFHHNFFPSLRFLHALTLELPKYPLGKKFRELYGQSLTHDLCQTDSFRQTLTFLRLMSLDDLSRALGNALCQLEGSDSVELQSLRKDMEGFVWRLDHLEEEGGEAEEDTDPDAEPERILPVRAKLHELKQQLQNLSAARRRSPYERLRDQVMSSLEGHLRALVASPLSLPLHQALYFTDLQMVKDQLKAAPRCAMQRALATPGKYLRSQCCQGDQHSIQPGMPDVCVVYKLHLECGTLVNLFDWMTAFATVVTADDEPKKGKKAKVATVKPTTELRARFIRAVSELQFLGFIKSTKKKTDHVTRLTW